MQSNKLYVETMVGGEYPPLKNKTIFAASQCADIVTIDEASDKHLFSIQSASDGRRWKSRGWKYAASILMFLMLSVGNAWAIDWTNYAVDYTLLTDGGKYYLWNHNVISATVTTDHMISAPSSYPTSTNKNSAWSKNASTAYEQATLFTFTAQTTADRWKISYKEGNNTRYLTQKAGTGGSSTPSGWNTNQDVWEIKPYVSNNTTYYPSGTLKNTVKSGTSTCLYYNTSTVLVWVSMGINTNGTGGYNSKAGLEWRFISEAAYEDATAGTITSTKTFDGAQYYYTANAVVYTDGSASTTGGTAKVAITTYKKPAKSNLESTDYATSISGQRGKYEGNPTITVYYKAETNNGYHFVGWFAAAEGGSALSENLEYTYSFTATSTSSGSPTTKNLYARFEQDAAAAAVYTGGTGEPTNYATLSSALTAAANGDLIVLQGNVGETTTISKNITLDFNGYKIQGSANNLVTVSGDVTFVDNSLGTPGGVRTTGATAVLVTGGSLTINDGKYIAATYAVERTGGSVTIKNGGFESNGTQDINGTITLNGGFFYHNSGLNVTNDYAVSSDIPTGMKYTTADYRYMVVKKTSENYPVCVVISKNENGDVVSRKNFNTLAKAIAYANNNANDDLQKTLLLREDCTLPAGNYTIPHHTILSIPYSAEQTDAMPYMQRVTGDEMPSGAYRTLTLANGSHIDVFGAIEVGGVQTSGSVKATSISRPGAPTYGHMVMNENSSITLYDGANIYAWGYITGEGTIDVRRGGIVSEHFQLNDWKTLTPTAFMSAGTTPNPQTSIYKQGLQVLPINQYFIQNVEVKATYRPGSRLYAQVCALIPLLPTPIVFNNVGIIGVRYSAAEKAADPDLEDDIAIFLMDNEDDSEDTWVRKSYDVEHDRQLYEVNNSAYLGSLKMYAPLPTTMSLEPYGSFDGLDVNSTEFNLPLTNNFKIHLLYGNLYVTQNTELLPGAIIEVNKKSTLTINSNQTLSLYDSEQWHPYVADAVIDNTIHMGYATHVKYRPGAIPTNAIRDISSPAGLGDAQLIVHGSVDVKGYLTTTIGDVRATPIISNNRATGVVKENISPETGGGASIISTITDAGTIQFSNSVPAISNGTAVRHYLWQVTDPMDVASNVSYVGDHCVSALLKNEDGMFTHTAGTISGKSYCFIDFDGDGKGEWKCLTEDGCFVYDEHDVYYAKPQDYVALKNGKTEEADHTYQSADGSRTLILVDDCQWWEVEPVAGHPDLFHCTHPQNNVYYYFDYESSKWLEKRYTVTWLDWDGTEFGDPYILKYGVQPKYLGDVPQRDADAYYTYDFIGWSPAITESTIVTGDVTYTAQFERKDVMYSVAWKDLAGNTIETGYYKMGDVPSCTEEIDMTGKEWNPAVGAVTGNTIYQLQAKNIDGPFDIKFMNWNGSQIGETQSVAKNDAPVAPADPSKPALTDIEFVFAGWRAANNEVYASNAIPAATANAVYIATFTEHLITYTITWKNYDGTTLLEQDVTPNTVPQYTGATPVHADDSYGFIGWSPTVVAATVNTEYVAQFELQNKMVDGETYSIPSSTQQTLTTITITDDGKLVIPASSSLTVNSLILEATSNASGQLDAPSNSNIVAVNAYFDLELNTDARHWHAFGVPWAVDINTNPLVEVETGRTLNISRDYEIMYYDGAERATNGPSAACWKYLRHYDEAGQPVDELVPGRGYMIAFGSHVNTVRFVKKSGAPIIYTGSVGVTAHQIGAISNPMAYHTTMDAGVGVGQVHDGGEIGHDGYDEVTITAKRFVVGKTVYIDPQSTQSVVISKAEGGVSPVAAPARRGSKAMNKKYLTLEDYYTVALINANGEERKVYVLPEEDKEDKYVVGHDLAKMGMSDRKAQIWVNRYEVNLGLNTTAPMDGVAEFPVNIYAPKAGEYTMSLVSEPDEEYTVYLTLNGEAVWNLSSSEYALELLAGTNKSYGLRLVANKAPQTATGIDEAVVDAQGEIKKVIINDKVFIIRGENVYSVDGQLVK